MAEEVNIIKVDTVFKVCPNCGYEDAFHSILPFTYLVGLLNWETNGQ